MKTHKNITSPDERKMVAESVRLAVSSGNRITKVEITIKS